MAFLIDWRCPECKWVEEDIPTSIKEKTCPRCGRKMEKIYSPSTVIFKGKGWTPKFCK
jgi:putative FmdB family regulatory protein